MLDHMSLYMILPTIGLMVAIIYCPHKKLAFLQSGYLLESVTLHQSVLKQIQNFK